MRLTVFTSNQPRHIALIEALAVIADEVFAVQECTTVFPGSVEDFYRKTPVMQDYFGRVLAAEAEVFGPPHFSAPNVRTLSIKMGDASKLSMNVLAPAMSADAFVVFGASYLRGELCDALVQSRAVNIHMGVSPYYRGAGTNFWAMHDRRPDLVGATVHRLSAGLDSGPMLYHALPATTEHDPFVYGMLAVRAAHRSLVDHLRAGTLDALSPVEQDRSLQFRYSRNAEFTDEVAAEYLRRLPSPVEMRDALSHRDPSQYLRPVFA